MKRTKRVSYGPSLAAILVGIIILLGLFFSFRCVLAVTAILLIAWGIWRSWQC